MSPIQDEGTWWNSFRRRKSDRKAGEWFDEPLIYQWFTEHLHLIPNHSMRLYKRAAELQKAGVNWVSHLLADIPEKSRLVAELRAIRSFPQKANGFWRLSIVAEVHGQPTSITRSGLEQLRNFATSGENT